MDVVTSYVDGDNRRTRNSLIYSRFLVIGFHKGVNTYQQPISLWENRSVKKKKYLPDAAPMIPQHQAKSKETTRVVNQGTLERPVRGEEGRDWAWLAWLIIVIIGGEVAEIKKGERKEGEKRIYLLKFIYEATHAFLKFFAMKLPWIRRKVNLNPIPQ